MKNMVENVQQGAKNVSRSLLQKSLRLITGFFVGIVFALIIAELTKSGTLILVFLTLFFMSLIFRLLKSFSILQIVIFQAFCVLVATLLRMYIMIAP